MQRGRIIYNDVDPAERIERVVNVADRIALHADIAGERQSDATIALDAANRSLRHFQIQVVARDLRAVLRERECNTAADVGTGAGDQSHLAFKSDIQSVHLPERVAGPGSTGTRLASRAVIAAAASMFRAFSPGPGP